MLFTITAATSFPVSVEEASIHCRAPENGDDEAIVEGCLKAAVDFVQRHTSLILAPTTIQERLDDWPSNCNTGSDIVLSRGPVRDVTDIEYLDEDGTLQAMTSFDYSWERTPEGATITFNDDVTLPDLHATRKGSVRITFEAGYDDPNLTGSGDDPSLAIPETIRQTILMLTSFYYENREAVSKDQLHTVPMAAEMMLNQNRVFR
jgi:uncharacterized phiE125 gp8 family phage protein